jgi:heterotetrameric sarcosine oxidase gamma subunit
MGLRCSALSLGVVELAAFRQQREEVWTQAVRSGWSLPAMGRVQVQVNRLALSVRPDRWLLLTTHNAKEEDAASWEKRLGGSAAVIDHSSGLAAFGLSGPSMRDVLARGCRVDLDPSAFPAGSAAATIVAQVPVVLGAVSSGLLLLTPSTTARHLREWLAHTATPFGFEFAATRSLAVLSGDRLQ